MLVQRRTLVRWVFKHNSAIDIVRVTRARTEESRADKLTLEGEFW